MSAWMRFTALAAGLLLAGSANAQALTGDRIPARAGGDLVVHPVTHAAFALGWRDVTVLVDPIDGGQLYRDLPKPTFVLITHAHDDHANLPTLTALDPAVIVAPQSVRDQLPPALKSRVTVIRNGGSTTIHGVRIDAVPMYNVTPGRTAFHPKGEGNGYVLTLGGDRVYVGGDTEATPEMKALKAIDVAFVPMNLPYTMTPQQAAEGVKAFKPKVVYPYHYRGQSSNEDPEVFRKLVGADSEVRVRDWYPAR